MDRIKEIWETASPGHKRLIVIASILIGLFIIVSIFSDNDEVNKKKDVEEGLVSHNLLMDGDPRSLGMDALNAKMKELEDKEERRVAEMARLERELQKFKDEQAKNQESRFGKIQSQVDQATSKIDELKDRPVIIQGNDNQESKGGIDTTPKPTISRQELEKKQQEARQAFEPADKGETDPFDPGASSVALGDSSVRQDGDKVAPAIRLIGKSEDKKKKKEKLESPLPSGSILTGVLLHGVDAPATGRGGGNGDNHPVLVRVKKEAILPNSYRTDIRDCHAILSGYGDLSSERAYFRSEKFSCVTNDGEVVDVALKGYAVGEDGKLGLRGPVVSKQGAIIARTMWAGFLQGWGDALGETATGNDIRFDADGADLDLLSDQVQQDAMQRGAASGFADSMDRLAQFYIDMADSMVPVIEIDGGRKISIVITSGMSFSPLAGQPK
jgi:conjugal transfer pilus assembly protein TraB